MRGVEEGYAGVEGNDQPHTFVITVDGAEVYSAQIGGPKDHEVQARDMNEARALIDARMTGEGAASRPARTTSASRGASGRSERQDVWQPARRDSQEVHMIAGLPRLKTVGVEGPYKVTGISATPSRERIFVCTARRRPADETACATQDPRRAWRAARTGVP